MFIDTHCHLHDREFFSAQQADEMLERARQKGVEKIICIGTNPDDSRVAQAFATKRKNVYWTYGIHPEFANRDLSHEAFLDSFFRDDGSCEENGWCKVGQGGIATKSEQKTRFRVMKRLDQNHIKIFIL